MDTVQQSGVSAPVSPYQVDPSKGGHDGSVSRQWMSRPHDQRFLSLDELFAYKKRFWEGSFQARKLPKDIEFLAPDIEVSTHDLSVGFTIDTPTVQKTMEIAPTHHAFGQLCSLSGVPAYFMRDLPSQLVADTVNWCIRRNREAEEIKIYGDTVQMHAATGPDYGRIPDYEVVAAVQEVAGDGRGSKRWKVPGVLDWRTNLYNPEAPVTKDSTTLYASDRDLFVFLVDDRNPIEVGKLKDGSPDLVFRGFYVQNSEMGARTLKLAVFYLRGVCMNRNLWGVEGFEDISIRHTRLAPSRWLQQAQPALRAYANGSTTKLLAGVQAAKEAKLAADDDEAMDFLKKRKFNPTRARAILDRGLKEEGEPPRTAWDFAQAITADARDLPNTDNRLAQELVAKTILDAVA